MKKIVLALVCALVSFSSYSQEWFDSIPTRYLPDAVGYVQDPASPVNQGDEPFSEFIKKWNHGNFKLRKERIKATANTYMAEQANRTPEEVMWRTMSNINQITVIPRGEFWVGKKAGYATYFVPSENFVGYLVTRIRIQPPGFGAVPQGLVITFERIDGKWYVTNFAGR